MECEILSYAAMALLLYKEKKKRKRKLWTKDWLLKRKRYSHINLMNELRFHPNDWHNYLRMSETTYLDLLKVVSPIILRNDTNMREFISAHECLTATLWFLATGRSYEDLKYSTLNSPQSLGKIIPETCKAIHETLKDYYKFPSCEEEWKDIGRMFENKWNFPNCLGAIDGKHVAIAPPPGAGSYFYNYKGFHSQVLLGIANANYEFIYFNYGTNGRVSDGGVMQNTDFYKKLENGSLKLPQPSLVKGTLLPYVFIGDEAFAMRKDFLKPFSAKQLNRERKIFNYRLSRARRIIENVFGILVARFGVLQSRINLDLDNIRPIVMACCTLHSFLRRNTPDTYTPLDSVDTENYEDGLINEGLRSRLSSLQRRRMLGNQSAKQTRELFLNYFNNAGRVPWQENFV